MKNYLNFLHSLAFGDALMLLVINGTKEEVITGDEVDTKLQENVPEVPEKIRDAVSHIARGMGILVDAIIVDRNEKFIKMRSTASRINLDMVIITLCNLFNECNLDIPFEITVSATQEETERNNTIAIVILELTIWWVEQH